MSDEPAIAAELVQRFPFLEGKVRSPRERRIFAEVPADQAMAVIEYAYQSLGFTIMCAITGLDLGATLVTNDRALLDGTIPGLSVENWV